MKAINIMKVADIDSTQISQDTVDFLNDNCLTYRDTVLKEHLYNVGDMDEIDENEPTAKVRKEIKELSDLCAKKDCGYIRLVYQ